MWFIFKPKIQKSYHKRYFFSKFLHYNNSGTIIFPDNYCPSWKFVNFAFVRIEYPIIRNTHQDAPPLWFRSGGLTQGTILPETEKNTDKT